MFIFLLIIVITNATESINNQEERNKEIIHPQIQSNQHKRMFNLHKVQLKGEVTKEPEETPTGVKDVSSQTINTGTGGITTSTNPSGQATDTTNSKSKTDKNPEEEYTITK
ncbi:hypothetical protein CL6EHI_175720 [Entamoeba histolytica]|uniref:Uncharacterized protein n=2 Tax=Entamoeba histolytica TaxID=5759 RepID=B1N4R0_ENTH1|nr:hypothetical protein EHI_175720 [Entamoeba histolytica HM-1:IMSS]EDS89050.1 hypothetical protein EHI_175720 [Entamoeba histolytica HM-1:IMSS]GAT98749.1 hypothetical protein CL6EHI_175720 [Entamoeba histolytica]|eukprot:XP_001914176.1 hypothetical protein EHI_175720 [Entamoeba histolytica HM-1:IMSS]